MSDDQELLAALGIKDDEPRIKPATAGEALLEQARLQTKALQSIEKILRYRRPDVWTQRLFWLSLWVWVLVPAICGVIYALIRTSK